MNQNTQYQMVYYWQHQTTQTCSLWMKTAHMLHTH